MEQDDGEELKIYGGYYSWIAATAGSGVGVEEYDKAPSSICPKGWHLTASNDYGTLLQSYGASWEDDTPFIADDGPALLYSGACYGGECSVGGNGSYWTSASTGNVQNGGEFFCFSSDYLASCTGVMGDMGYPIRCVANN